MIASVASMSVVLSARNALGVLSRDGAALVGRDADGTELVEYALVVGIVAVGCVMTLNQVTPAVVHVFELVKDILATPITLK
jgi:Flp pilus assembly pilin Flp